jgi:transcriptional regulator with XRE-family HTH domain
MNKLRKKAEKLRSEGYSYSMINQKLGISKSTMSYWFKDKPFRPNQEVLDRIALGPAMTGIRSHNRRVEEIKALKQKGIEEIGELSERELWLIGIGLYIGEGSKTTERVRIINSDPDVIKFGVRWLKDICGLSEDNITIALHIYPDNNPQECVRYWQGVTGIPRENFRKTQVDRRENKKKGKRGSLPHGTAHVSVASGGDPEKGVKLYRKLNGWMAGVLQQK